MAGMAKDTSTRMNFFGRLHALHSSGKGMSMCAEERNARYSAMADEAFDEEESKA
jgi:hypothetical protein